MSKGAAIDLGLNEAYNGLSPRKNETTPSAAM